MPVVLLDDIADGAQSEAVVLCVLLRLRQSLVHFRRLAAKILKDNLRHAHHVADADIDAAVFGRFRHHRLNRVVQRIAEERKQLHFRHEAENRPVNQVRELYSAR